MTTWPKVETTASCERPWQLSHVTVWFVQETWGSVSVEVTAIDGELQRGQRSRACSSITGVAPGIVAGDEWLTGPPVVRSYGACSVPVHHD